MIKEEVFAKLKERSIVQDGCWLWQGSLNSSGHGTMRVDDKVYNVHRLSAWISWGLDLSSIEQANHTCSNPSCWNPKHLYIGNQVQNAEDAIRNGFDPGKYQRSKTHCPRGHEYTEDNTYTYGNNRQCKKCFAIRRKLRGGA